MIIKNVGRDFDQQLFQIQLLVKRITTVCKVIAQNDKNAKRESYKNEDDEIPLKTIDIQKLLPEVSLMDYVLQLDQLMTVEHFCDLILYVPPFEHYDEKVWPIPFDFTPNNIYDNGKYDVNYMFG